MLTFCEHIWVHLCVTKIGGRRSEKCSSCWSISRSDRLERFLSWTQVDERALAYDRSRTIGIITNFCNHKIPCDRAPRPRSRAEHIEISHYDNIIYVSDHGRARCEAGCIMSVDPT